MARGPGRRQWLGGARISRGALGLLIASAVVSAAFLLGGAGLRLQMAEHLVATADALYRRHEVWTLLTSPLLETDFLALLFSGFMLYLFFPQLERLWGTARFLRFAAAAGPLAVIALESGWIATEVGRQPWVVYGVMRTTDAVGDYTASLWWLLGTTTVVYSLMTWGAVVVLRSMARRWREGAIDLPSPYAPDVRAER
jgi:cytochrome bd-type quinol oxidase subunit 1